ncbi:hypothetical protein [Diaphorobacter sp. LR2014-1]|uniref:hypothetical protein n=1 Tax=Diaphorobacter sp. LR2014-1 TaxID=1933219 RepID=UPI0011AF7A43|nr:hypothetical protein [Diaphorobacter sp. LR2014-1]
MTAQYDEVVRIEAPINTIKARQEQVKRKRRQQKHVEAKSTATPAADAPKNLSDFLFPNGI